MLQWKRCEQERGCVNGMEIDIARLAGICRSAGEAILEVYKTDFAVERKEDNSPVTQADRAAHAVIAEGLAGAYPEIPVISEEGADTPYEARREWRRFWLVDPLDGTKEFVKRNGEFTVNIALVEDGFPVFGMIYAPVFDLLYYGDRRGAFKAERDGAAVPLRVRETGAAAADGSPVVLAASRSHPSPKLAGYLERLQPRKVERLERGSSLKFCTVAEGAAHVYPRFGGTMEWDTAAGQAIVEAAGGAVRAPDGTRLRYNKEQLRNGHFIAACGMEFIFG